MLKNSQTAYNAGRDMFDAGWAKACPYVKQSPLSAFWWRGWFDAERNLLAKTSG
jgi:hypothetical protein